MHKIFFVFMAAAFLFVSSEKHILEEKSKKAADIQIINIFFIQVLPQLKIIPS